MQQCKQSYGHQFHQKFKAAQNKKRPRSFPPPEKKRARLRNFRAKEFDANFTPTFRIVRLFGSKQRCHVVRQIPHVVLPFDFAVMQDNSFPDAFPELFLEAQKRFDVRRPRRLNFDGDDFFCLAESKSRFPSWSFWFPDCAPRRSRHDVRLPSDTARQRFPPTYLR